MYLLLTSTTGGIVQMIAALVIVILVLVLTGMVTKWIGNYQQKMAPGENIMIVEAKKIAPSKLVEIVRIGDKYYALGIGKDEVTLISEIEEGSLELKEPSQGSFSFKDFMKKAREDGETSDK